MDTRTIERIPGLGTIEPGETIPDTKPTYESPSMVSNVGGAIVGAVLGAGVGVVAVTALAIWAREGGVLGGATIGAGIGAVGGGIAGVALNHGMAESKFDRQQELYGPTIDDAVDRMLAGFDHSRNGSISLTNPTGLPERDEQFTFRSKTETESTTHWDPWKDDGGLPGGLATSKHKVGYEMLVSGKAFMEAANTDGNQTVSKAEIAAQLTPFDVDGNGHLSMIEQAKIAADDLIVTGDWRRTG